MAAILGWWTVFAHRVPRRRAAVNPPLLTGAGTLPARGAAIYEQGDAWDNALARIPNWLVVSIR